MKPVIPAVEGGFEVTIVGKQQGFAGLPVAYGVCDIERKNAETYRGAMYITAWRPSDDDLKAIAAGAAVYIAINSRTVAPMNVYIGEVPDDVLSPSVAI